MFKEIMKALKSPHVREIKTMLSKENGQVVFVGTNVSVTTALEALAGGQTVEEISGEHGVPEETLRSLLLTSADFITALLG